MLSFLFKKKEKQKVKSKSPYQELIDKQNGEMTRTAVSGLGKISDSELKKIAENLEVGDLSNNVNYRGIERIGKFLSPIGNDNLHIIKLTEKSKGENIVIAELECTNSIYSEWVSAICQTIWHFEHHTLEDIHGNKYPVGQRLNYSASVNYVKQPNIKNNR